MRAKNFSKSSFVALSILSILPVVFSNQCSADDIEYWEHGGGFFEFEDVAEDAGQDAALESCADCTVSEFFPLAEPIIAQYFSVYSKPCQDCFNGLISCVRIVCLTECVSAFFQEFSQTCEDCAEANCRPPFTTCSGISVVTCDGCTNPEDKDLVPIIAGAVGAVVAVVGAFGIFKGYKTYKNAPTSEERAKLQLVDMGILVEAKSATVLMGPASERASSAHVAGTPTSFPDSGKYGEDAFPDAIPEPFPDSVPSMPPMKSDPFPDQESQVPMSVDVDSVIPMSVADGEDEDEPPADIF
mmetsp:Transcript_11917/g.13731  ORF Transcript_11917/g.13731 Transcript_11917/m.13731 type:complete len:299 (+) Transcript_11917:235-1131(+)